WTLNASHECLEMLADPSGDNFWRVESPAPGWGPVEILLEVCDPCTTPEFAYQIDGVVVSDFYTPQYFDPVLAPGVRYSFTGSIAKPLEVLRGGYITWREPVSGDWFQLRWWGDEPEIVRLQGQFDFSESIRTAIDTLTHPPKLSLEEARAKN